MGINNDKIEPIVNDQISDNSNDTTESEEKHFTSENKLENGEYRFKRIDNDGLFNNYTTISIDGENGEDMKIVHHSDQNKAGDHHYSVCEGTYSIITYNEYQSRLDKESEEDKNKMSIITPDGNVGKDFSHVIVFQGIRYHYVIRRRDDNEESRLNLIKSAKEEKQSTSIYYGIKNGKLVGYYKKR